MMESCEPLASRRKINPFFVPECEENTPILPLRPWRHPTHEDYYVSVDQTQEAFESFQNRIGNLAGLRDGGRLVLVAGESGCGKTSLIHRCAAWLEKELPVHGLSAKIIDLTTDASPSSFPSVNERIGAVSLQLVDELSSQLLLSASSLEYLRSIEDQPARVYRRLGNALEDPTAVLVILLPPSEDLVAEVEQYARLTHRKMVLFAESWHLDRRQVQLVQDSGRALPPVVLQVGELNTEDVSRYARDRLTRHRGNGMYPDMDDEALESLPVTERLRSIAGLQTFLCGVYEHRRRQDLGYHEHARVTYQDIAAFVVASEYGLRPEPPSTSGTGN